MAMNKITRKFNDLKAAGSKALVGYLTAGDPDMTRSESNIRAGLKNGIDLLEIGVPFSDPTADGPTIQAAGQRALRSGATLRAILAMAKRLRKDFDNPMVLFSYANPLFVYGYERVCRDAAESGIDGLLVVDMPFEEAGELRGIARERGLLWIPLIAPTTPVERARKILAEAEGFVYYILVKGVTGKRNRIPPETHAHLDSLRQCTDLPIAVGFGISNGRQAAEAASFADGVVVGSALVEAVRQRKLVPLVRELAKAAHGRKLE